MPSLRVLLAFIVFSLCFCVCGLPAGAAPPPTLAAALAALPPTEFAPGSVYLCVGADKIPPVKAPVPLADPLDNTLAAYGQVPQFFVHVAALAPTTMTVLNTSPDLRHLPLARLAQQEPLSFLVSSLSPAQLQQLAGPGLGFSDLDPDQAALLQAALPSPFKIIPADVEERIKRTDAEDAIAFLKSSSSAKDYDQRHKDHRQDYVSQTQTLTDEALRGVRLRADLFAGFDVSPGFDVFTADLEGPQNEQNGGSTVFTGQASGGTYRLASQFQPTPPSSLGPLLRGELPNAPKPGDLLPKADHVCVRGRRLFERAIRAEMAPESTGSPARANA